MLPYYLFKNCVLCRVFVPSRDGFAFIFKKNKRLLIANIVASHFKGLGQRKLLTVHQERKGSISYFTAFNVWDRHIYDTILPSALYCINLI